MDKVLTVEIAQAQGLRACHVGNAAAWNWDRSRENWPRVDKERFKNQAFYLEVIANRLADIEMKNA
jgi:hypothetical protein